MRLVLTLLAFFLVAQLLGFFTGYAVLNDINANPYVSSIIVTSDAGNPMNAFFFICYTLLGATILIFVIRALNIRFILFRIMEFMILSSASSLVFYAALRLLFNYEISTISAIIAGLALAGTKTLVPELKNAAAILSTAGVGVVFGMSLGLIPALIFLVLLSIYDFCSVFMTKHMVELAEYIISKDLAFTVTAKMRVPETKEEKRIDLGTGDLIAPIVMEVSLLPFSPTAAIFVMLGSFTAMAVFLILVWKHKLVLPALPPILLGMLSGLLLWYALVAF